MPLTFQGLPERKYRFVHVEANLYDPTIESFEYFIRSSLPVACS